MKKSDIKEDLLNEIEEYIYKKASELDISVNIYEKDILVYGSVLEKEDFNEINIFVRFDISQYNSSEKYQEYGNEEFGLEYSDGEINAKNDLNKALNDIDNLKYKNKVVKINVELGDYEDYGYKSENRNLKNFILEEREKFKLFQKIKLLESDKPNIINSKKAKEKFAELGDNQRDKPERKMLECQRLMGGGVISHLLEHIGDLTHRMSEKCFSKNGDIESTIQYVEPKVKKGLRAVKHPYGIEKEHMENMRSNYEYYKKQEMVKESFDKWYEKVVQKMKEYSEEHGKLNVYNEAQKAGRDAAISLGNLNFKELEKNLEYLNEIIENDLYVNIASDYNADFEKIEMKNKKTKKLKI